MKFQIEIENRNLTSKFKINSATKMRIFAFLSVISVLNSQIHHKKCQEPLKVSKAIHPNSMCNRISVRHIGTTICYLFIYF